MSEKPSCQACQAWMEDAFSGELDPALRPRLEAHLGECADCRAVWADFQTLRRGMEVLAESEGPSLRAQTNILRAAEAKAERRAARGVGLWSWLLRPATVAFATLLLIAGIGYLGRQELQKRDAGLQKAPELAPQGTSTQETSADALSAPPPPRPKEESAPAAPTKPKLDAPKPEAAAKKPIEAKGRGDAEEGLRLKDGGAPAGALHRASPPPPMSATGAASEAAPVPLKSLAKPAAEPKPADLERSAPSSAQPAAIPEAQRGLGGATSGDAGGAKDEDKAKKQEKAAAPAPAAEVAPPAEAEKNLQQEKAGERMREQDAEARYQSLLNAAKAKIRRADYAGALEDLLAAQRIRDTREIQDLILLCRSHLRGDG